MKARFHKLALIAPLRDVRVATAETPGEKAEHELREREEAAYQRGRLEGEEALSRQLVQQRNEMLQIQQGVLESLRQTVPQVIRECEQALVQLALEVGQRLVAGLPLSAEMVEAAVREALAQLEEAAEQHVYLNPFDLELLRQHHSDLLAAPAQRLQFHPSPAVARGGCLVKTQFGVVDATREKKLDLLQKELLP